MTTTPTPWNTLLNGLNATNLVAEHNLPLGKIALTEHAIITVSGPDAVKFLQGQGTCDFTQLANNQWLQGAHCNAKGRMQSSFVAALLAPDCIGLRVHASIAATALTALRKYSVFSKVTCEISSYLAAALINNQVLQTFSAPSLQAHTFHNSPAYSLLCHSPQVHELWFLPNSLVWETLNPLPLYATHTWQQLMVAAGIAEVQANTQEVHTPQAFNYDLTGGVSFKKGCYTGQEIIARLHYKGQSKQRLHRLAAITHTAPTVGQNLCDEQGKAIGCIVAVAPVFNEHNLNTPSHYQLLASSNAYQQSAERLLLEGQSPAQLQSLSLPYAIP